MSNGKNKKLPHFDGTLSSSLSDITEQMFLYVLSSVILCSLFVYKVVCNGNAIIHVLLLHYRQLMLLQNI